MDKQRLLKLANIPSTLNEGKITKTFHFKGKTSTDIDEIDADFSRQGIKSNPDFNNRKVTVTGDENKIKKIAKFHRGVEESVNEGYTGNSGDKLTHKYDKNIEIELIEPTNRGWKVYQTYKGKKRKIAYFDKQDIVGNNTLFESVNEGKSDLDMVVDTIRKEYENVPIKKLAYHLANKTTYTIDQLLKVLRAYKDMNARDRDKTDLKKLFKSYGLKESVNERYRPNLESKGWETAQKVIKQLQSSVFRKLDDDELLEFRKAIADAFNLDGILK